MSGIYRQAAENGASAHGGIPVTRVSDMSGGRVDLIINKLPPPSSLPPLSL